MLGLDAFQEHRTAIPNVYFDTSGSERVRGKDIQHAVDLFGADHVLFGTDTPYAGIQEQIGKIVRLNLPASAKDKIFGLNFASILSQRAD
jgi:predicted TIM-barrel fold metal-dependent hydrolase